MPSYELQSMSSYFTGELTKITCFSFRLLVSNDIASPFGFIKEVPFAPRSVSLQLMWECCINNQSPVCTSNPFNKFGKRGTDVFSNYFLKE